MLVKGEYYKLLGTDKVIKVNKVDTEHKLVTAESKDKEILFALGELESCIIHIPKLKGLLKIGK